MVLHTLSLGSFVILPWLEMSGKVEAPFRTKTLRSSSLQLTIRAIAYDRLWVH